MKKPQLPKKWKGLKWGTVAYAGKDRSYPRVSAFVHYNGERAVGLHDANRLPCVVVTNYGRVSLSRLVRAVELAAIHAGLVEDRDQ